MAKYLQNSTDIEINESGDNLQFTMVKTKLLNLIYPVGSIYMSATNTNSGSTLGGTWVAWGSGKVPVGIDSTDADFDTAEKIGGAKKVTLTEAQMPKHTHNLKTGARTNTWLEPNYAISYQYQSASTTNSSEGIESAGGNQPHNNVQPYIVCYMCKRTA